MSRVLLKSPGTSARLKIWYDYCSKKTEKKMVHGLLFCSEPTPRWQESCVQILWFCPHTPLQILKSLTFCGKQEVVLSSLHLLACVYRMTNEPYEMTFPLRLTPVWKKQSAWQTDGRQSLQTTASPLIWWNTKSRGQPMFIPTTWDGAFAVPSPEDDKWLR